MAYSAITNGEIDPDSPLTTSLATKFRDNPEAIADDLAGATPVQWSALTGIDIDAIDFTAPASGSYEGGATVGGSTASTSNTKLGDLYCPTAGTYSVRMLLTANRTGKAGTNTAYGRIYVNGVATGTQRSTTSTTTQTYDENITVAAGDLLQIYGYTSLAGDGQTATATITPGQSGTSLMIPGALR